MRTTRDLGASRANPSRRLEEETGRKASRDGVAQAELSELSAAPTPYTPDIAERAGAFSRGPKG